MKNLIFLFLYFVALFNGYSQVARNLETKGQQKQQIVDNEDLLQSFYQQATHPGLMERGTPTIFKGEYLEAIQFPVGGIGTGCIQYDGSAVPRYWQIFNNMTHDFIPNSFFAIRVKSNDGVSTRALQTKEVAGFPAMKELNASSKFPFLSYRFIDDIAVDVGLDVYNPFIPTDLKNSGIPAAFYTITLKNKSSEPLEISLLASQQNSVGFSRIPKITEGDSFAERFQKSINRKAVVGNKSDYYGNNRNRIEKLRNMSMLLMEGDFNSDDEHFGAMALMLLSDVDDVQGNAGIEYNDDFHNDFKTSGDIKTKSKSKRSIEGETWAGALNAKITLAPGERKEMEFALVWYFPNGLNGGHLDSWDAWGKGTWEGQGNYYANYWYDIQQLSGYIIDNHRWLKTTTATFSESLYKTNLPFWLIERLGNQLAILKSRTIFHDKNNYVGLWEGCGAGDGSCAGNCNHVWHYAQAHARLFPQMGRKIKEQSFKAVKSNGQIPYRQPNGSPAFDGQCGDIIGAYREYLLSNNDSWIKTMYPNIKKAMNYLIVNHDEDKDGWLSDAPKHTTYDASMTGNPSILTSLYLTALSASAEMAKVAGDIEQAEEWQGIAVSSGKLQNDRLWNGEYFIQIPGDNRATDYENGCMTDQLLGQWWADQLNFDTLYPNYRIFSATRSVFQFNFKSNLNNHIQVSRKFAKPDEAGMVGTTWPGNDRTKYASGYSDEIWTSYEYTIGASLIKYGLFKEAFILLRSGYDRYNGKLKTGYKTDNGWGNFGFSGNPFGDDECGQFYSRALSNWSVLLATQGFQYNGPQKTIGFNPRWKPENHKSFFSTAQGWGNFSQQRNSVQQTNTIELLFGELDLKQVSLVLYPDFHPTVVNADINRKSIDVRYTLDGRKILLDLMHLTLRSNQILTINIQ